MKHVGVTSLRFSGNRPACHKYINLARTLFGVIKKNGQKSFVWSRRIASVDGIVEIRCQQTLGGSSIIYIHVPLVLKPFDSYLLISQVLRPNPAEGEPEEPYEFYTIESPSSDTHLEPKTPHNEVQISENANSHTWSEFDNDGKITRQLATVITNLEPSDYQHPTDGLPYKLYVLLGGKYIAKITEGISKHFTSDLIMRRLVSPAFFYKDNLDVTRVGVITVTQQDVNNGSQLGHTDVSRWSAGFDAEAITESELIELETVQLAAVGILKNEITLNLDGSKAAFAAGNKGLLLTDINLPLFNPAISIIVDFPSGDPTYSVQSSNGRGRTYNTYARQSVIRCFDRGSRCDFSGNYEIVDHNSGVEDAYTRVMTKRNVNNYGDLLGFGFDILTDDFNTLILRPAELRRTDSFDDTGNSRFYHASLSCLTEAADNGSSEEDVATESISISTINPERIELTTFSGITLNPTGVTVFDASYSLDHTKTYTKEVEDGVTIIETTDIRKTEVQDVLLLISVVDISTGTFDIIKQVNTTVDANREIVDQYTFVDGKNNNATILKTNTVSSPVSLLPPYAYKGIKGEVIPTVIDPIPPEALSCSGCGNYQECTRATDKVKVSQIFSNFDGSNSSTESTWDRT